MQFTKKSQEHIDSCRFCWMCHHVCPIGNATGLERNTARARALGLSLVMRDAIEYSEDIINNVYECSLCGGCMTDCVTGWDPVMYTKEARLGAALDGKLPQYVMTMLQNIQTTGNIYGADANENTPAISGGDTLFFLGEDARVKGNVKTAVELLKRAGVDITVLKDEPNSGYSMDFLIGAAAETKAVMENCAKILNHYKKIICYDGADAKVMKIRNGALILRQRSLPLRNFWLSLYAIISLRLKRQILHLHRRIPLYWQEIWKKQSPLERFFRLADV